MNSATFRVRPCKTPISDPHNTLDTIHQKKIEEFKKEKEKLPLLKKQLAKQQELVQYYESKRKILLTKEQIDEFNDLKIENKKLEKKIYDIEFNVNEVDYFSDTFKLIYQYYTNEPFDKYEITEPEPEVIEKKGIENVLEISYSTDKSRILDDYLTKTDIFYSPKRIDYKENIGKCVECKSDNLVFNHTDSNYVCHDCGVINDFDEKDEYTPSFKELQDLDYNPQYAYKRLNHYLDHLNNIQALHNIVIPDIVLSTVEAEMKKERLDPNKLTDKKVRIYLKKHRLSSHYNLSFRIINHFTNQEVKTIISETLKLKLISMFEEIQKPWFKNCPKDRYNFFSYKYIIYKFCELLGEDDVLPYCTLLSRDKLYGQDEMWKGVCKELRWEFIPTV